MKRKIILSLFVVLSVVFGMSFNSYAYYTYIPTGENYCDLYGSGITEFITLDSSHVRYYSDGHFENVSLGVPFGADDQLVDFEDTYGFNLLTSFPFLTYGYDTVSGLETDLAGMGNTIILTPTSNSNHNNFECFRFTGDNVCLLATWNKCYICSSIPFEYAYGVFSYDSANSKWNYTPMYQGGDLRAPRLRSVESADSDFTNDTVYAYDITHVMNYNTIPYLQFTNVPVYSTYQTDANISLSTFAFSEVSNYFNLNMNNREGMFDPEPEEQEPEYVSQGQYYNYVGIDGFFSSYSDNSISNNLSFSYNDYMRLHPEEYSLRLRYDLYVTLDTGVKVDSSNLPTTFGYSHDIPLVNIYGYRNQNSADSFMDLVQFSDLITLSDQHATGVTDFNQFLKSFWAIESGSSENYYNDGSTVRKVTSYGGSNPYGGSNSFGKYKLGEGMKIKDIKIICRAKMVYTYQEPETSSGYTIYHYNFFTGENVVDGNASSQNFNPPPENSPEYGNGQISGGGGGSSYGDNNAFGGSGGNATGGSVTINGLGNQPVYTLNETQLQGIAEMLNYISSTLQTSQENNGFWQVLKGCYDYIPERIWTWIIVMIGAVCSGAVARWYLTSKR